MIRFRKSLPLTAALVGVAMLGAPNKALASFQMRLTSGSSTVLIDDGDLGGPGHAPDAFPATGTITFVGSVGGFVVQVSTGISKPTAGYEATSGFAKMHLDSVSVTSTTGGTLIIELTDTDFPSSPLGVFTGVVGGVLASNSSASFAAYKDSDNAMYGTSSVAVALGPFNTAGSFGGSASLPHGLVGGPNGYSMTMVATVTHESAGTTSFNFDVTNVVPAPAGLVLALTGMPVFGFGAWLRRRKSTTLAA